MLCNLLTWEQQGLTGALCHVNMKGHANNILATSTPFIGFKALCKVYSIYGKTKHVLHVMCHNYES